MVWSTGYCSWVIPKISLPSNVKKWLNLSGFVQRQLTKPKVGEVSRRVSRRGGGGGGGGEEGRRRGKRKRGGGGGRGEEERGGEEGRRRGEEEEGRRKRKRGGGRRNKSVRMGEEGKNIAGTNSYGV